MPRHRVTIAVLSAGFAVFSIAGLAADCSIDSTDIDRGQRKPFFICSKGITDDYRLTGLDEANITIAYDQYIKRCAMDDNRHGVFFWLEAQDNAETAVLNLTNSTGEALCDPVPMSVPERVVAGAASLTAATKATSPILLLTIEARKGQDFSGACEEGVGFPTWESSSTARPPRWPKLSLLSASEIARVPPEFGAQAAALDCSEKSIRALVKVRGQQREPAKIIIREVELGSGGVAEGVAYVMLPEPAWANAMRDEDAKFIDVDGINTRYWEKGSGPALLLLHGGQPTGKGGGALTWSRVFDGLSEQFRVFAIDRVAQGQTDNLKRPEDYARYYEHVVDHAFGFVNAVGVDRVGLVGHSQGGWPVGRIALDHPDRVSCVVSVDSVLAPGRERALHTARYYLHTIQFDPPGGETVESMRRTSEFQSHTLNNITDAGAQRGYELAQLPKLNEAASIMSEMQMNPRHPDAQALFEQARQDIAAGMLQVPSLVIWGYNDPSSPYPGALALFEIINVATPVSELHVFNQSGHASHVEYPEEFTRVVGDFCSQF